MRSDAIAGADINLSHTGGWRSRASKPTTLCLFAFAYLLAYGYGNFYQTAASPLWFPDSVLLCALLLTPRREWWLYLAIAVPIRFIPTPQPVVPLWFLCATTANDVLKAPLAAYLIRRLPNGSSQPVTISQLATFLGVSVFFVPALSASAGAATRHLIGYSFWVSWYQWFLGDALANLVLTPTLLYWNSKQFRVVVTSFAEIGGWIVGFVLSLVLALSLAHSAYSPIAFCIPVPFLIWAATRFGLIGASTPLSVIALLATARLVEKAPFFSMGFESKSLLFLQVFLFVISVPVLGLAVLIEERSAVEKNLRESQVKLRKNYEEARFLAGKLISAQDDERKRIALELHDDVVQRLALLAIQLAHLDADIPLGMVHTHTSLQELRRNAEEAAGTLRGLSHQLHSTALQYVGLHEALSGLCRGLSQQHQISINVEVEEPKGSSDVVNLCLFRVAQEAISNVIKHSNAGEATVKLTQNDNQLRLEIQDDGIGFNPSKQSNGLGLISMRERVRLLNGTILIESRATRGTTIRVHVPLASEHVF